MYELQVKSKLRNCLAFRWQSHNWMQPGAFCEDPRLLIKRELRLSREYGLTRSRWPIFAAFACGFAAAAVAWSYFSYQESYAVASGKVQLASSREISIRPSRTGKLLKIDVVDGSRVNQGDSLAEFDSAEENSTQSTIQDKLNQMRAEIQRQKAAIDAVGTQSLNRSVRVSWKDDVPQETQIREDRLLNSELTQLADELDTLTEERRQALTRSERAQATITAEKAYIDVLTEQFKIRDELSKQNFDSKMHVLETLKDIRRSAIDMVGLQGSLLEANAAITALDVKIERAKKVFIARKMLELGDAQNVASDLQQKLTVGSERMSRITLSAPVSGTVKAFPATSVGKIVTPDETLMDIVTEGGPPKIVAYLPKTEIGFVEPNQEAVIKVGPSASDSYGAISGRVTQIADEGELSAGLQSRSDEKADRLLPKSGRGALFPVVVAPSSSSIKLQGKDIPLAPGMSVSVKIKTDKRRMMDYLLSPILMVASSTTADFQQTP